ncbi:MAG: ribosome small subunit-dependent GTPase A [Myxococcales bacterium]|nr:ribosome small subunit-dependent GTPase A [Myxococcales bacterium]
MFGRLGPVFTVRTAEGEDVECVARGDGKRAVVGDDVRFVPDADTEMAQGLIIGIGERRTALVRADALGRREQVLAANLDRIFVVTAVEPPLREGLIDRYLVVAHAQGIEAHIIFNKVDLIADDPAALEDIGDRLAIYPRLGYPVHFTAASTGAGLGDLRRALRRRTSIFVGHSGVGKTSLLNALDPALGERVQALSEASGRGRHTTSSSFLHVLPDGGEVIDSPGVRAFGLWDIDPDEVGSHFVELARLAPRCKFADCRHVHEPECAVLAAVEAGRIEESRYASYVNIRTSLLEDDPRH